MHDLRVVLVAPHAGQRAADGGRDGPRRRGLRRARDAAPRPPRTSAASELTAEIGPDTPLVFTKFLAYGWSSQRSLPSVRDQVDAARWRAPAHRLGRAARRASASTSTTSGTAPTSRSRATASSSRRSASRSSTRCRRARAPSGGAIPAKGLTGPGYDGHVFWDTETFVLPVLTYTHPEAAADALRWRHATLDLAQERARTAAAWRRGVPVAHDPRAGVLGVLAGRDGGVPHQRRHRRRRRPLPRAPATRPSSASVGPRAARRDGAAVALARAPRPRRRRSTSTA